MTVQDDAGRSKNNEGVCQDIDAYLTPSGSRDVLAITHRDLRVKRNKVGADTPLGWNLSNLDQQITSEGK